MSFLGAMLIAMALDAVLGWPHSFYVRFGHPVTWLGRLVSMLDARFNRERDRAVQRRIAGMTSAIAVIGIAAGAGALAQWLAPPDWAGTLFVGALAWPLVAIRSMHTHVEAVALPLVAGDLEHARIAVSRIVGRDPSALDEAGVSRAAIESLAENTSDGIIAPIFWGALLGLPGIAGYKAINTLDSMIGHRTPRHESFGWAAARIDDLANIVPARLTAVLFALVSGKPRTAISATLADARKHRSPNAGWPEAAMAGALGIRLSGPRVYGGQVSQEPWINAEGRQPQAADIDRGLALFRRTMAALALLLAALFLVLAGPGTSS
jgi:adenosylcobinamide-phosphate synthase